MTRQNTAVKFGGTERTPAHLIKNACATLNPLLRDRYAFCPILKYPETLPAAKNPQKTKLVSRVCTYAQNPPQSLHVDDCCALDKTKDYLYSTKFGGDGQQQIHRTILNIQSKAKQDWEVSVTNYLCG